MNLRTITSSHARATRRLGPVFSRPPVAGRRPALSLAVAAAGAVMFNVVGAGEPAAQADSQLASVSVAEQLGITAADKAAPAEQIAPLEQLAASRSERDAERTAAADAQAAADKAELDAQAAAAEAARVAAEQAAQAGAAGVAEAEAARARRGSGTSAAAAPAGSYQDYAMNKLGGSASQFSCLENLWGKESGWNPNAQNP